MRRVGQTFLIPFWVLGFIVGVVVLTSIAVWSAGKAGYRDITTWIGRRTDVAAN